MLFTSCNLRSRFKHFIYLERNIKPSKKGNYRLTTMQYSVNKPCILAFMCMPVDTNHLPNHLADQAHLPRHPLVPQQDKHRSSQKNITESWADLSTWPVLWPRVLCLKQGLGGFYGPKNNHMKTRIQGFTILMLWLIIVCFTYIIIASKMKFDNLKKAKWQIC